MSSVNGPLPAVLEGVPTTSYFRSPGPGGTHPHPASEAESLESTPGSRSGRPEVSVKTRREEGFRGTKPALISWVEEEAELWRPDAEPPEMGECLTEADTVSGNQAEKGQRGGRQALGKIPSVDTQLPGLTALKPLSAGFPYGWQQPPKALTDAGPWRRTDRPSGGQRPRHINCPSLSRGLQGGQSSPYLDAGAILPRVNANEFPPPAAPREAAKLAGGGNWPRTDTSCAEGRGSASRSPAGGWEARRRGLGWGAVSGGSKASREALHLRGHDAWGPARTPGQAETLWVGAGPRVGEGPGGPERPRVKTSGLRGRGWTAGSPGRR
ncbi:hypothetical protein R6Z07F_018791 [Ovis aries]